MDLLYIGMLLIVGGCWSEARPIEGEPYKTVIVAPRTPLSSPELSSVDDIDKQNELLAFYLTSAVNATGLLVVIVAMAIFVQDLRVPVYYIKPNRNPEMHECYKKSIRNPKIHLNLTRRPMKADTIVHMV